MKRENTIKDLIGIALFIAIGVVLPIAFHALQIQRAFSPMHLPILLCGLCLGPIPGLITPFVSSFLTGMPVLYPTAISMAFELMTYGFLTGLLYRKLKLNLYLSLILALLAGKVVGGIISAILYTLNGEGYSFGIFVSSYFITALPGIILMIIIVPLLTIALEKTKVITKP